MRKALLSLIFLVVWAGTSQAQMTTFVPNCGGADDTARLAALITKIGANTGTIRLPYKDGTRCATNTITFPENITLDNSDGTGLWRNAGAVVTVLGPVVNPVGKQLFFGPGTVVFTGNTHVGTIGQALLSNGDGTTEWGDVSGGGGIGPTTGSGAVVLQTSPTLITPDLGVATASSINKLVITPPATSATLTIANGKTLTVNSSLNLSGTDGTSVIFGQPLTVGGSGGVTLSGAGTLNLAGFTGTVPASGTFAMGAGSVSVNSANNFSTALHTHAVSSSANPGASAALLASDADGYLQIIRLGIGTAPSQPLEVAGNVFVNAASANLFLKDVATGWRSSTSTLIHPQPNNSLCTTNFTSGLVGWCIRDGGNAEFANVDVRGAIRSSIFVFNALQATAGTVGVFKSAAKLRTDLVVPNGPTYGTTTVNIDVVDQDGLTHAASQLFVTSDILRLKDGLAGDTWFRVASVSDQSTFWRYTSTIMAGSANVTYRAGLGVADYGQSGQGFIIQTADQANSPYLQMATHGAAFTSQNSSGTLVVTPRLRLGNLNDSYGYLSNTYGFGTGQYGTAGQSWLTVDPVNGVRIGNNTNVLTQVDAAGNASFSGTITASAGAIAGWAISSNRLTSGTTHIASSFDPPSGQIAWFGQSAAGFRGMALRDASNREIDLIANNGGIFPYLAMIDGTRARVVIGGLNNGWGAEGATSSMGMKIWDSSGGLLAQFHDLANSIAGWSITTTRISAGATTTTVGMDATVTGGDDVRFFAGNATPSSAPFRVTEAGALVATSATVTGSVTATSGSLSNLSIVGLLTMSGAASAITIGTTPPTSASAGTGLWLDRTGLYGLASGVLQAKIDATTGAFTAGAGTVTLDSKGISILDGADDQVDSLKFYNASFSATWPNYIGQLSSNVVANATFTGLNAKAPLGITNQSAQVEMLASTDAAFGTRLAVRTYGSTHATLASKRVIQAGADSLIISSSDSVLDPVDTVPLDVRGDNIRISTAKTPASASAACTQGVVAWDASFIYICVSTNTWKRSAISTW